MSFESGRKNVSAKEQIGQNIVSLQKRAGGLLKELRNKSTMGREEANSENSIRTSLNNFGDKYGNRSDQQLERVHTQILTLKSAIEASENLPPEIKTEELHDIEIKLQSACENLAKWLPDKYQDAEVELGDILNLEEEQAA